MIRISLNNELDYEVYKDFCNFSVAGVDFGEKIRKDHPSINPENYKKYIDIFYIKYKSELLKKQKEINQLLERRQDEFMLGVKEVFKRDFETGIYRGYLSIFNCNPRYLDTKTFQIYYKKDLADMLEVVFHESLHFVFFDYLEKKFSEQIKGLNNSSGILWELSEIVNVIILNLPQFRKILEREEMLFYPELRGKLIKAKNIWNSCGEIEKFISLYLKGFREKQ